jgi:hypothetical protein
MIVNYKKLKGITCIVLCKPGDEKKYWIRIRIILLALKLLYKILNILIY